MANDSLVSREQMEEVWASLRESAGDYRAGLFGPSSVSWRVNRESAVFLGAGRAALLQLAHPWVAMALEHHSNLRSDPVARFHNTFRVMFTIVFGTVEQALTASRHLHSLHTRIQGELSASVGAYASGSHYRANEVHALIWVYATLVESALMAYDCVSPPLSAEEREVYYVESKRTASLFGISAEALPKDWGGFEEYNRAMWASQRLAVNELSREMAHRVLHGRGSWVPIPGWYRALTAAWMPERLRKEFALEYGAWEQESAARAEEWLPEVYRRLPATVRFVGPYHEAGARLSGRPVGPLVGLSNRFWMGQPRMMSSDLRR
jgi:uncharacterized protein (DUF2236 family)